MRVNLEGMQVGSVLFHGKAVNAAVGHVVRQTSEVPPKYLIKLMFSFRGISEEGGSHRGPHFRPIIKFADTLLPVHPFVFALIRPRVVPVRA